MTAVKMQKSATAPLTHDRVARLLARLAVDPVELAEERRLLPVRVETRLRRLLAEIDEIVLPRLLHLCADGREVARLAVSHRHLIAVDWPGREPSGATSVADHFAACLLEFAETRGDLSLRVSRRSAERGHSASAVSVGALETSLGLAPPESSFDRLCRMLDAISLARLRWNDRMAPAPFHGAPEWREVLARHTESYRHIGKAPAANASIGALRTDALALAVSADEILVIASLAENGIAAILPRKAGLDAIAAWQKLPA